MRAYNKTRKRKVSNSNYMVSILLENCEMFNIPSQYIHRIEKKDNYIRLLEISKEYINVMDNYISYNFYDENKELMKYRFKTTKDTTCIYIREKCYGQKYIDEYLDVLGTDNVLQTTTETKDTIRYEWDLDKRIVENYIDLGVSEITIHSKYKNKLHGYRKINYYN